MATTTIQNHRYEEIVIEFKLDGKHIVPKKVGCWCGMEKKNRVHGPMRIDSF